MNVWLSGKDELGTASPGSTARQMSTYFVYGLCPNHEDSRIGKTIRRERQRRGGWSDFAYKVLLVSDVYRDICSASVQVHNWRRAVAEVAMPCSSHHHIVIGNLAPFHERAGRSTGYTLLYKVTSRIVHPVRNLTRRSC